MRKTFRIISVNISKNKGEKKIPVNTLSLKINHGIEGDAHAGNWHRQISLLAEEDIDIMRAKGIELIPGDFAENIATRGVKWLEFPIGTLVRLGDSAVVEITQIGKECHTRCAIYYKAGDCIMPSEGIFGKVLQGGSIRKGDTLRVMLPT